MSKCEIRKTVFGKEMDVYQSIFDDQVEGVDVSYKVKESIVRNLIKTSNSRILEKINLNDKVMMLNQSSIILDLKDLSNYIQRFNRETKYVTLVELIEEGGVSIFVFGDQFAMRLYSGDDINKVPYDEIEDEFIKISFKLIYGLDDSCNKVIGCL